MTAKDKIYFSVLAVFIESNTTYIESSEFRNKTKDILGEGFSSIIEQMKTDGLIDFGKYMPHNGQTYQDHYEYAYTVSVAGQSYYQYLKKQEVKDRVIFHILIWTLVAALIGAISATVVLFLPK